LTVLDGIAHLTLQSLTETFTTFPEPAVSWALLELDDAIAWQVFGRDPFQTRLPAHAPRWVTPLPRFADMPESQTRRHEAG
jgi:hypothetical protein